MGEITGLVAVAIAALFGLILSMRFMRRRDERRLPASQEPAFYPAELHAMLNSGQITPAEFERLQALVLAQRKANPSAGGAAPPRGPRGFEPVPLPLANKAPPDAGNPPAGR